MKKSSFQFMLKAIILMIPLSLQNFAFAGNGDSLSLNGEDFLYYGDQTRNIRVITREKNIIIM